LKSGWMTLQSAASHPTRRTLREAIQFHGDGLFWRNKLLDDKHEMLLRNIVKTRR